MPDINQLKIDRTTLAPKRQTRWLKPLLWIAVVSCIAGGAYRSVTQRAVTVQTATVVNVWPAQAITVLNATGYVAAQRKAAVASKATGRLEWIGVCEGSRVKAGELIARLENSDLIAQVDQAKANILVARGQLREAEADLHHVRLTLRRTSDLYNKNLLAQADLDLADANLERALAAVNAREAALAAAQANERAVQVALDNATIRAPFDGVVLNKNANIGDLLSPFNTGLDSKGAVVNMVDMDTLEVEADVSEASLSKVQIGQVCEILLDALPDSRLSGRVRSMVPTVDRSKATVIFKIAFTEKHDGVLPDMSAKVAFLQRALQPEERHSRIGVSPSVLRERNGKQAVVVVKDGRAEVRIVEVGVTIGDFIELKSGVVIGEKLVLKPDQKLQTGTALSVGE